MTTKKKPILNELFESRNNHIELAPEIDKKEFIKTVTSRRSVRVYNKEKVKEEDMWSCMELALLAPNSSNLQPWEFYWVRSAKKKTKIDFLLLGSTSGSNSAGISCSCRKTRLLERQPEKNVIINSRNG